MLVAGPVCGRSRHGVYRWTLRVQTINAENRPMKASRITNIRILLYPPFRSK